MSEAGFESGMPQEELFPTEEWFSQRDYSTSGSSDCEIENKYHTP
jgi:hypothetical protein